jgi:TolA-binding protein
MKPAFPKAAAFALLAALAAAPAHAQIESREGIALQNQISELRRDIDDLRQNAGGGGGGGGSMLGGARRGGSAQAEEGGSDMTPVLLERINRLEDAVRQINGKLDELANTQSRQQADLSKQIADLQFRLDNGGAPPAAGTAAPSQSMSPPPAALGTVPAKAVPPAAPAAPAAAPAAAPRTPEQALQEGNAALARRDYGGAESAARQVLAIKGSPHAYDAQLLLAQAYAGQKKPVDAALAYGDLYQRNKQGVHAQDALLGLASSQLALGDKHAVCVALDSLKAQFPTPRSDIAPRAATLRTSAGCH